MPDTVIAHVEQYGKENALPGIFDFAVTKTLTNTRKAFWKRTT
jgi:hypothetical protein